MLKIALEADPRLDSLGRRLRKATSRKTEQLTKAMYDKVVENVSGRILQKRTGDLARRIKMSFEEQGDHYTGEVFVDPVDDKAWVLEHGGKGYYPIIATKAKALHFFTKSGEEVFTKSVNHPPSQSFRYLASALEEIDATIPEAYAEAIETVLYGGEVD